MSKLQPLNGYIILKPIEAVEESYGNIIIPDLGKERPEMGEVIETSDVYNYRTDKLIPSSLKKGDTVLIPKLGSQRIVIDAEEYFIVKESDIFSIVKN